MKKFFLFINTIKFLKVRQIFYRAYKFFPSFGLIKVDYKHSPIRFKNWQPFDLYQEKIDQNLYANFLNYSKKLNLPEDWNNKNLPKLWLYNLHYFEDLLSPSNSSKKNFQINLIHQWIDENKISNGNGWEPYTISLRLSNFLKAWLAGYEFDKKILDSIYLQARYLNKNLEKHLLGNHYFANLKALFFFSVIFQLNDWIKKYEKELINEINEQILSDGAHFELSPMYHNLILLDLLDLYNLSKSSTDNISSVFRNKLGQCIPLMMDFMNSMSHFDDKVSFFNDSVSGIAPTNSILRKYSNMLGFKNKSFTEDNFSFSNFNDSGYFVASHMKDKIIFDASPIGPDYIPSHAHADTLSFEASINGKRVFVNSGTSEYKNSKIRLNERKTKSHNTVVINDIDSSQVWSSFRVAKRAEILRRGFSISGDSVSMQASHNGYNNKANTCIHSRKIIFGNRCIQIEDKIFGKYKNAEAYFHIHPDFYPLEDHVSHFLVIKNDNTSINSNIKFQDAVIDDAFWSPEFGIRVPNKVIKVSLKNEKNSFIFRW